LVLILQGNTIDYTGNLEGMRKKVSLQLIRPDQSIDPERRAEMHSLQLKDIHVHYLNEMKDIKAALNTKLSAANYSKRKDKGVLTLENQNLSTRLDKEIVTIESAHREIQVFSEEIEKSISTIEASFVKIKEIDLKLGQNIRAMTEVLYLKIVKQF
jgi:hypothetical protein